MMAVQYAYRVKKQTTISCIVYGQIQRPERDRSTWTGRVYDMTALVQLDEIVRMLADRGVEDPKAVIDSVQCLGCGVCAYACRTGALVRSASEERR